MKKVTIQGDGYPSQILVGEDYRNFRKYLPEKGQVIVLTDERVFELYGEVFSGFPVIQMGQTEKVKNLETVDFIIDELLRLKADRSSFILAVGGGIVCDTGGFVASIYQRGIRFGFISTTLLSQVDASVGGKNGVNHRGFKNMVGTFNQPEFVICDPKMLHTLPDVEIISGLAEIVKHTLIADAGMFEWLEKNFMKALQLDTQAIEKLVANSIKIKASIVNTDEKEQGERKKLNLGHTWGHAVEKVTGLPHGHSVAIGLAFAANLSVQKAILTTEQKQRILNLLTNLKLPVDTNYPVNEIKQALSIDKKKEGDTLHFILMKGIGNVEIKPIPMDEIQSAKI